MSLFCISYDRLNTHKKKTHTKKQTEAQWLKEYKDILPNVHNAYGFVLSY